MIDVDKLRAELGQSHLPFLSKGPIKVQLSKDVLPLRKVNGGVKTLEATQVLRRYWNKHDIKDKRFFGQLTVDGRDMLVKPRKVDQADDDTDRTPDIGTFYWFEYDPKKKEWSCLPVAVSAGTRVAKGIRERGTMPVARKAKSPLIYKMAGENRHTVEIHDDGNGYVECNDQTAIDPANVSINSRNKRHVTSDGSPGPLDPVSVAFQEDEQDDELGPLTKKRRGNMNYSPGVVGASNPNDDLVSDEYPSNRHCQQPRVTPYNNISGRPSRIHVSDSRSSTKTSPVESSSPSTIRSSRLVRDNGASDRLQLPTPSRSSDRGFHRASPRYGPPSETSAAPTADSILDFAREAQINVDVSALSNTRSIINFREMARNVTEHVTMYSFFTNVSVLIGQLDNGPSVPKLQADIMAFHGEQLSSSTVSVFLDYGDGKAFGTLLRRIKMEMRLMDEEAVDAIEGNQTGVPKTGCKVVLKVAE